MHRVGCYSIQALSPEKATHIWSGWERAVSNWLAGALLYQVAIGQCAAAGLREVARPICGSLGGRHRRTLRELLDLSGGPAVLNSDALRQQLQRLQSARTLPPRSHLLRGPQPPACDNSLAKNAGPAEPRAAQPAPGEASLTKLVPGEVVETSTGTHYRVVRSLSRWFQGLHAGEPPQPSLPPHATSAETAEERLVHPDLLSLRAAFPRDVLFMDLETCGFAGSQIFLVGTLYHGEDGLMLDQRFARDYREEVSILEAFWNLAAERPVLATFNGKSFDWPMVCDRSACHRLPQLAAFNVHADLLHHARRAWKLQLPNCRLQTLESRICRRQRGSDIPGSQIPAAYHGFVRDGDARLIRTILYHNAMDLITLAEVAWHLTAAVRTARDNAPTPPASNAAEHSSPAATDASRRSSSAA